MKRLIAITQFLTRIPIPIDVGFDEEFHKSTVYFPTVGLLLGILYYITAFFATRLFEPYIASVLVVMMTAILTGGLHLDGVGDTFDGLYSYRSKERILEIMKDSRLGTNALLGILFLSLLKIGFVYELLEQNRLWPLILMPVFARTMQVVSCYRTKTPRENGMGNFFIGKVSTKILILASLSCLIMSMLVVFIFETDYFRVYLGQLIIFGGLCTLVRWFVKSVYKKIDGITGDILGCICELMELMYLILISIGL